MLILPPLYTFIYLFYQCVNVSPVPVQMPNIVHKSDKELEYKSVDPTNDSATYDSNLEGNVSKILDALIASHDRRIRPKYGGAPTEVNVTIHVITISAISEVSMDYTVDLYLRQFWQDHRLAFQPISANGTQEDESSLTVGIDMVRSIWVPDTFFPNEKKSAFHETTSHNSFLRINNHGQVVRSIRLTVTANCPMHLEAFPLDTQVCALEVESYGYSTSDIIYHWHKQRAVTIDDNVHLAHFSIAQAIPQVERTISLSTGNYSRLTTYFTFRRQLGFYLIQVYFPSSLIVVISWVSFFLNREATQARVTIGVTTVLTQTTLMTSTNAALPKVSYVKSLDVFLGICFCLVFSSLLQYAFISFLMKRHYRSSPAAPKASIVHNNVCYYELDELSPSTATRLGGGGGSREQQQRRRAPSTVPTAALIHGGRTGRKSISSNGPAEQIVPLIDAAAPRYSIFVPEGSSILLNPPMKRFTIRPSQVDLFSRIAFPLFFLIFHIFYWTIYANI